MLQWLSERGPEWRHVYKVLQSTGLREQVLVFQKIDTSRVGSSTVIRSPVSIPPAHSPTTLLESRVLLYNKMDYSAYQQNQSSSFGQPESNLLSNFTAVKDDTDERNVKPVTVDSIFHYSAGEQVDNGEKQNLQRGGIEARLAACIPISVHGGESVIESQDAVDVSSMLSNEEERVPHLTVSADCDGDEDETEFKRKKNGFFRSGYCYYYCHYRCH